MTILITESDVLQMLSVRDAIAVTEECFRLAGEGKADGPPRFRMPFEGGFLQFGPASIPSKHVMGFKMWANFGSPLTGTLNFLYSSESGELLAIIQSHLISKFRTAATTAVAASYLAREDARSVGLYGSGRQALAQLEALCEVRPIRRATVYSRRTGPLQEFCKEATTRLGVEVAPAAAPEAVPAGADIVVTMTNSYTPVLLGDRLDGPCLVVAAGGNHWYERELDEEAVRRASRIVVDQKEHAKVESGDLLWAVGRGLLSWNHVCELGTIVASGQPTAPGDEIVLFESHGLAIEDVAISAVAYERAMALGLGREVELWPEGSGLPDAELAVGK